MNLPNLKSVDLYQIDYDADVQQLVVLFAKCGYLVPQWFAKAIWESYSEQACAGWLLVPDSVEMFKHDLDEFIDWEVPAVQ